MKRKLEREDFSKRWETSFRLRGGLVVKNQTTWVFKYQFHYCIVV